jgi:hypothetical protein
MERLKLEGQPETWKRFAVLVGGAHRTFLEDAYERKESTLQTHQTEKERQEAVTTKFGCDQSYLPCIILCESSIITLA